MLSGELHLSQYMAELLQRVSKKVMPVWPLKDFVAVNPYAGLSHQSFLKARMGMRSISDAEMLMPMTYYVEQFAHGAFGLNDIRAALFELGDAHETLPTFDEIRQTLQGFEREEGLNSESSGARRVRLKTLAEFASEVTNEDWSERVLQEVSKHCVAHFDEGQAVWRSPWRELPLYCAWREAAAIDRTFEWLGVQGFRRFVSKLPCSAEASIVSSLQSLGVPFGMWEQTLTCYAYSMHGWSAWAKYKAEQGNKAAIEADELSGLIAIRMAYDVALAEHLAIRIDWESYKDWGDHLFSSTNQEGNSDPTVAIRYVLLRAHEIAFRSQVLAAIKAGREEGKVGSVSSIPFRSQVANSAGAIGGGRCSERKLAQMVFCIDVRSERLRRHLEEASSEIETFGFAGFFGMPFSYARFGESTKEGCSPDAHLPVLLKPRFQVEEGACGCSEGDETKSSASEDSVEGLEKRLEGMGFFCNGMLCLRRVGRLGFWVEAFAIESLASPSREPKERGLGLFLA